VRTLSKIIVRRTMSKRRPDAVSWLKITSCQVSRHSARFRPLRGKSAIEPLRIQHLVNAGRNPEGPNKPDKSEI